MNKNMKSKRNRFRTLLASCLIVCADYTYGNPGDFTALQNAINEAQEYIASHASSYTGTIVALYQDEVNIAQDLANEGKVNQTPSTDSSKTSHQPVRPWKPRQDSISMSQALRQDTTQKEDSGIPVPSIPMPTLNVSGNSSKPEMKKS